MGQSMVDLVSVLPSSLRGSPLVPVLALPGARKDVEPMQAWVALLYAPGPKPSRARPAIPPSPVPIHEPPCCRHRIPLCVPSRRCGAHTYILRALPCSGRPENEMRSSNVTRGKERAVGLVFVPNRPLFVDCRSL